MAGLPGNRVLVLGGETALGRALVIGLAEGGADVAIASLSPTTDAEFAVNSALNELWAMGREGLALPIDASDPGQLRNAVERAERDLGRLDAAALVAADQGAVAVEALRDALPGREVVVIDPDTEPAEGMLRVSAALGG
jgi:NAD(P)-dependent dehydrogenase (short-subunit alcohol dehydrogenase family)